MNVKRRGLSEDSNTSRKSEGDVHGAGTTTITTGGETTFTFTKSVQGAIDKETRR